MSKVTRGQIAAHLSSVRWDNAHTRMDREAFWLERADAILALFPPAPSTVGTVEELEALPPNTALLIHGGQNLAFAWELDPDADLPATVLTPATTRDVGAVTEEQVLTIITESSVEHYDPNYGYGLFTTEAKAIAYAIARAASTIASEAKGDGK